MEAWYKYDEGEMMEGEYSQDFFANSEMIFTIIILFLWSGELSRFELQTTSFSF